MKTVELLEHALQAVHLFFRAQEGFVQNKHSVSHSELDILQLVCRERPMKMKEISVHYHLKLSTLTSIVNKAESKGLLVRTTQPEDRRVVLVSATEKGNQIFEDYLNHMKKGLEELLDHMNQTNQQYLFKGFHHFLAAFQQEGENSWTPSRS